MRCAASVLPWVGRGSLAACAVLLAASGASAAPIVLNDDSLYSQAFDTLASTGSSNTALPTGWVVGSGSYAAGSGTNSANGHKSYGATASGERALGSLGAVLRFGAEFQNATGFAISDLAISYTGEQWRKGNNASLDSLFFEYSTDATSLGTGTWTSVSALDFASPIAGGGAATALNGNLLVNQSAKAATISGLSIANGASFWIRWRDEVPASGSGQNHGLAVDGFGLTPTIVPEPGTFALTALGLVALAARRRR